MLNLYLRYFNLTRIQEVVDKMRSSLHDAPIDFDNVYLVVGDFTGLVEGASEVEAHAAGGLTNGGGNLLLNGKGGELSKIDWSVDGASSMDNSEEGGLEEEEETTTEPTVVRTNGATITTEDIFNDFQYSQVFDANTTSFVDLAHNRQIDDGLNVSHGAPKNIKKSSCNVLCRDKLPPVTDPFREAIYRTKSPFELPKVPSARDAQQWRNEKLTGHSGVIREGLCHMAIPRDWMWGGPASDHCPVWLECYKRVKKEVTTGVTMNGTAGRVAKEMGVAVMSLTEAMNGVMMLKGVESGKMSHTRSSSVVVANGGGMSGEKRQKRLGSVGGGGGGSGARSLDEGETRPVQ